MNIFLVIFEDGKAISAYETRVMKHGDVSFYKDGSVRWYAVECDNSDEAMQIAQHTVNAIWGDGMSGILPVTI